MERIFVFSERLKDFFEERDIKSEAFSKILNISGSTVRSWCEGRFLPSLFNAVRMANFFNSTVDYLLGLEEDFFEVKPRGEKICFYERLRMVMKEKQITRYRLTKETQIKDSHLNNWKNGCAPRMESLIELAEYFKISIEYLLWGNS